jgi:hypothetical protein
MMSLVLVISMTISGCKSNRNLKKVEDNPWQYMPDTQLCITAVNNVEGYTKWDKYSRIRVNEAQRRGLSLKDCAAKSSVPYIDPYEIAKKSREAELAEKNQRRRAEERIAAEAEKRRIKLARGERNRKLEIERQRKAEAERIRIANREQAKRQKIEAERQRKANAERIRIAKVEQTKRREDELRKRLAEEHKRQVAAAHEREMAPIRKKNRRSFAVIIGNRNYSGRVPTVDYAHNDADAMKQFIINKLGYREGNIFDLRDAGVNAISAVLGNEKSYEGELFNVLKDGQSDVIIYYSGHGVPGLKDKKQYLLPVDGDPNSAEITGFSVDAMYANLAKLPARSVTVFLDACFSGESEKGMLISSASGISVNPRLPSSAGQMTIITAAQSDELASWDTRAKHGLFTKHLLNALNGEADKKRYGNSDGKVSLREIQNYLDDEMTYQARATWKRRQNAYVRGSGDTILSTVFRVP